MDTCSSGTQSRGDRAIGPYDYVSCGETSEKVGCSIALAWVGWGAAFDERGHSEVRGAQGGVDGHKISFFPGGLVFLPPLQQNIYANSCVALAL